MASHHGSTAGGLRYAPLDMDVGWHDGEQYVASWGVLIPIQAVSLALNVLVIYLCLRIRARDGARGAITLYLYLCSEAATLNGLCLLQCAINLASRSLLGAQLACSLQALYVIFLNSAYGYTLVLIAYSSYSLIAKNVPITPRLIFRAHLVIWAVAAVQAVAISIWPSSPKLMPSGTYCFPSIASVAGGVIFYAFDVGPTVALMICIYALIWRAVRRLDSVDAAAPVAAVNMAGTGLLMPPPSSTLAAYSPGGSEAALYSPPMTTLAVVTPSLPASRRSSQQRSPRGAEMSRALKAAMSGSAVSPAAAAVACERWAQRGGAGARGDMGAGADAMSTPTRRPSPPHSSCRSGASAVGEAGAWEVAVASPLLQDAPQALLHAEAADAPPGADLTRGRSSGTVASRNRSLSPTPSPAGALRLLPSGGTSGGTGEAMHTVTGDATAASMATVQGREGPLAGAPRRAGQLPLSQVPTIHERSDSHGESSGTDRSRIVHSAPVADAAAVPSPAQRGRSTSPPQQGGGVPLSHLHSYNSGSGIYVLGSAGTVGREPSIASSGATASQLFGSLANLGGGIGFSVSNLLAPSRRSSGGGAAAPIPPTAAPANGTSGAGGSNDGGMSQGSNVLRSASVGTRSAMTSPAAGPSSTSSIGGLGAITTAVVGRQERPAMEPPGTTSLGSATLAPRAAGATPVTTGSWLGTPSADGVVAVADGGVQVVATPPTAATLVPMAAPGPLLRLPVTPPDTTIRGRPATTRAVARLPQRPSSGLWEAASGVPTSDPASPIHAVGHGPFDAFATTSNVPAMAASAGTEPVPSAVSGAIAAPTPLRTAPVVQPASLGCCGIGRSTTAVSPMPPAPAPPLQPSALPTPLAAGTPIVLPPRLLPPPAMDGGGSGIIASSQASQQSTASRTPSSGTSRGIGGPTINGRLLHAAPLTGTMLVPAQPPHAAASAASGGRGMTSLGAGARLMLAQSLASGVGDGAAGGGGSATNIRASWRSDLQVVAEASTQLEAGSSMHTQGAGPSGEALHGRPNAGATAAAPVSIVPPVHGTAAPEANLTMEPSLPGSVVAATTAPSASGRPDAAGTQALPALLAAAAADPGVGIAGSELAATAATLPAAARGTLTSGALQLYGVRAGAQGLTDGAAVVTDEPAGIDTVTPPASQELLTRDALQRNAEHVQAQGTAPGPPYSGASPSLPLAIGGHLQTGEATGSSTVARYKPRDVELSISANSGDMRRSPTPFAPPDARRGGAVGWPAGGEVASTNLAVQVGLPDTIYVARPMVRAQSGVDDAASRYVEAQLQEARRRRRTVVRRSLSFFLVYCACYVPFLLFSAFEWATGWQPHPAVDIIAGFTGHMVNLLIAALHLRYHRGLRQELYLVLSQGLSLAGQHAAAEYWYPLRSRAIAHSPPSLTPAASTGATGTGNGATSSSMSGGGGSALALRRGGGRGAMLPVLSPSPIPPAPSDSFNPDGNFGGGDMPLLLHDGSAGAAAVAASLRSGMGVPTGNSNPLAVSAPFAGRGGSPPPTAVTVSFAASSGRPPRPGRGGGGVGGGGDAVSLGASSADAHHDRSISPADGPRAPAGGPRSRLHTATSSAMPSFLYDDGDEDEEDVGGSGNSGSGAPRGRRRYARRARGRRGVSSRRHASSSALGDSGGEASLPANSELGHMQVVTDHPELAAAAGATVVGSQGAAGAAPTDAVGESPAVDMTASPAGAGRTLPANRTLSTDHHDVV